MAAGDAAAPPETPPKGAEGRRKLLVLVIVAVLIVAGLGVVAYILLSAPVTPPPPEVTLDRVVLTAARTTIDQREILAVTARAVDTEGEDQTPNSSFAWSSSSGSPPGTVQITQPGFNYTAQIVGLRAGAVSISAVATWKATSKTGYHNITVAGLSFELVPSPADPLLGELVDLTITVRHPDATVASSFQGQVNFTANYAALTVPGLTNFLLGDQGVKNLQDSVVVKQPGTHVLTATDILAPITGSVSLLGNRAPVANIVNASTPSNPLEVTLDGRGSSDPDGDALTYSWDFGDLSPRGTNAVQVHTYASAGAYTVTLTVTDTHQDVGTATQRYQARAPPRAQFAVESMIAVGADVRAQVNASASTDPDGTIAVYNWTWGDGNMSEGGPVTTHLYNSSFDGQQVTITLRVTDNDGIANSSSQTVTVSPLALPPVAAFTYTRDQLNRTVLVDGSGSSDPNGNLMWYNWTWGDGSFDNLTVATASHRYAADNTYRVRLTVVDTTFLSDFIEQLVDIQQPLLAPVALFNVTRFLMHVDVDGRASYDLNGDLTTYEWDFQNDGTPDATGPLASWDYSVPNKYTVALKVYDALAQNDTETKQVSVATSTIDYTYYDFFEEPYGEWWDYRFNTYGDLPINAECFNGTSIANGVCTANDPLIDDTSSYPYTDWYPLPGALQPGTPQNNPLIYAPYRFHVNGMNVGGYNRSEPVFLPVLNYAQAPGSRLEFDWRMQYLDTATANALELAGCPISAGALDGFQSRSTISLTMDLQQSRRMFGVVGGTAAAAQAWWDANTDAACFPLASAETAVATWLETMGGPRDFLGKYDIASSFEWWYVAYYVNMVGVVDPDGTTHVTIDTVDWGMETLLARMFYWGNVSYKDNYLDSTKARGWWGMELAWMEDLMFAGRVGAASFDFNLTAVMQYHFQQLTKPGSDGNYDQVDDEAYWAWGPILSDYTDDWNPRHMISELERYPSPTYGYVHSTPGSKQYGVNRSYDYPPIRWDLAAGQTWHFQFPTGNVLFYDPNLTPIGADPRRAEYVRALGPFVYDSTQPASYGTWDAAAKTWDVLGPSSPGGPVGSPGLDGIPGTVDDQYALAPWGSISLVEGAAGLAAAAFAASSGSFGAEALTPILAEAVRAGLVAPVIATPASRASAPFRPRD